MRSKVVCVAGPKCWNKLPVGLRDLSVGLEAFARHLKAHLFRAGFLIRHALLSLYYISSDMRHNVRLIIIIIITTYIFGSELSALSRLDYTTQLVLFSVWYSWCCALCGAVGAVLCLVQLVLCSIWCSWCCALPEQSLTDVHLIVRWRSVSSRLVSRLVRAVRRVGLLTSS